jgi:hypothetical protein
LSCRAGLGNPTPAARATLPLLAFFQRREIGAGSHEPKTLGGWCGTAKPPHFHSPGELRARTAPPTVRSSPAATHFRWLPKRLVGGPPRGCPQAFHCDRPGRPRTPVGEAVRLLSAPFRPAWLPEQRGSGTPSQAYWLSRDPRPATLGWPLQTEARQVG